MPPYTKSHKRLRELLVEQREARENGILARRTTVWLSYRCPKCGQNRGSKIHKAHMRADAPAGSAP